MHRSICNTVQAAEAAVVSSVTDGVSLAADNIHFMLRTYEFVVHNNRLT